MKLSDLFLSIAFLHDQPQEASRRIRARHVLRSFLPLECKRPEFLQYTDGNLDAKGWRIRAFTQSCHGPQIIVADRDGHEKFITPMQFDYYFRVSNPLRHQEKSMQPEPNRP